MNGRFIDITGQKFGLLYVIEISHIGDNHLVYWKCKCDCGNNYIVHGAALRKKNTKSCGCLRSIKASQRKYIDMSGQKYGMLSITNDVGRTSSGKVLWECLCDCGNTVYVPAGDIRSGS